jgi:hypothetical protein
MAIGTLRELDDWTLEDDEQDIVGWPLVDDAGGEYGTVRDLIVDTDQERVVEIVTDREVRVDPRSVEIGDGVVVRRTVGGEPASTLTGIEPVDMSVFGTNVPGSMGVGPVDERTRPRICRHPV